MSLLTNPLLLATLATIITLSSTQDEGQRETDTSHTTSCDCQQAPGPVYMWRY